MKTKTIKNISFEDIWSRLNSQEKSVCCTRGTGENGFESIIAWNPVACFSKEKVTENILKDFKRFVHTEQKKEHVLLGYVSYNVGYCLFDLKSKAKKDILVPDLLFYGFKSYVKVIKDGIKLISPNQNALNSFGLEIKKILQRPRILEVRNNNQKSYSEFKRSISKEKYIKSYEKVKNYITEGDVYQLNLTHRLEGKTERKPREIFILLWQKNDNNIACTAYIEGNGFEILSASPERFIKISKDRVIDTLPIKGTRPRGKNKNEDLIQKDSLINSEKESAELNMITDLLRNDLGKICEIGSVKVIGTRIISPHKTVWHTHSHIQGKLLKSVYSVEALLSMFPGGSITGCPKKRAIEIIDEVEPTMRGVYTGCMGLIFPDDSLDMNIAIRTLVKVGQKVYLQVGGGIVYDSQAEKEYEETFDKAKSFLGIL